MNLQIERRSGYGFRALQMSLAVHAVFLLIIFVAGSSLKPPDRSLVIDFRMDDSANGGSKVFAASEVKTHRDIIRRKAAPPKAAERKQKTQASIKEEQKQDKPLYTSAKIPETSVSEEPQVISQINPVEPLAHSKQIFAAPGSSHDTFSGPTGSSGSLKDATGSMTTVSATAYGSGSGGQSRLKGEYLRKNFSYIRDRIQKRIIYPPLARRMGWEGKVTVSFVIVSDGRVNTIEVKESSGRDILDESAVETIESASPFPAPPVSAQIIIPILYRLN